MSDPFDFNRSILKRYLQTGQIKQCPAFEASVLNGFERSCGGYGYNNHYIGSSIGDFGWIDVYVKMPAKQNMIRRSAAKIAFADAAIANGPRQIVEYSFVEPPLNESGTTDPSLHFRHGGAGARRCNIGWADGHVSGEVFEWTYSDKPNLYGADNQKFLLGFFGPRDNTLFRRD